MLPFINNETLSVLPTTALTNECKGLMLTKIPVFFAKTWFANNKEKITINTFLYIDDILKKNKKITN